MLPTVLASLAPARRRLVVAVAALCLLAILGAGAAVVLTRDEPVTPAPRDRPGPVLLVSGYGGSTSALQVLASALDESGRDARVVPPVADGTGDLREQAAGLREVVEEVLDATGAPSVDLVGYSAGGVVTRIYLAELGGGPAVRRAITLASPHHGTDVAAAAGLLGSRACRVACRQLEPDSELLRRLNVGDETPPGPDWVSLWTDDDATVVPPDSGALDGALAFSVQSVCPGRRVAHPDVPRDPAVVAMVVQLLAGESPSVPGARVCPG